MKNIILALSIMMLSWPSLLVGQGHVSLYLKHVEGNHYQMIASSTKGFPDTTVMDGDTSVFIDQHSVTRSWVEDSFSLYGQALQRFNLSQYEIGEIIRSNKNIVPYHYDSDPVMKFYFKVESHHIVAGIKKYREGNVISLGIDSMKEWDESRTDIGGVVLSLVLLLSVFSTFLPIMPVKDFNTTIVEGKYEPILFHLFSVHNFLGATLGRVLVIIVIISFLLLATILLSFKFFALFELILPSLVLLFIYFGYKKIKSTRKKSRKN